METLILSCGTGGGHNMAGKAVVDELKRRGHGVTCMDPYQLAGRHTVRYVGDFYIKLVQHSPKLFGCLYSLGDSYRKFPIHSPVYWANGKMAAPMQRYLEEHHYDCIIMTHMYPAHILAHLNRQTDIPKTALVATDYTCIPFMEESSCDYYVVPASDLSGEFSSRGIPREKILPFGIPVRREFTTAYGKKEARARLGLSQERKYILLAGGEIGAGQIAENIKVLHQFLRKNEDYTLLALCGKNRRLYKRLQRKYAKQPQIRLMERTPQMADYMKACDLFITKPGGLSSTEAAVSGIPLIHISPIPGCETQNANYFLEHGMSAFVRNPKKELLTALYSLQQSLRPYEMVQAQKNCVDPQTTIKLCDFMEQAVNL